MKPTLVLFRNDLRLDDNPALAAAWQAGAPVIPVFLLPEAGAWTPGGASRWWLHHSLVSLSAALARRRLRLVIRRGSVLDELDSLVAESGAGAVYWNRRYEPEGVAADTEIKSRLVAQGLDARSFCGGLLFEPHTVRNRQGGPFQVFTPFWRHCLGLEVQPPSTLPEGPAKAPLRWPRGLPVEELGLLPRLGWAEAFPRHWQPGEEGAQARLREFLASRISGYDGDRDIPSLEGTSGLSPHLHFGEIGPRRVHAQLLVRCRETGVFPASKGEERFLAELGWREFAHHLLFHFPDTPLRPLRRQYESFPWAEDPEGVLLRAWQRGQTGYPIVDAGMRQLWATGWMHNRVRMIAGSFLVKHLRLPWQHGARWFWDTLVDADLASNTLGWQWVAGCGADASPYFRIFNPVLQGEKFDADGAYVRRWVPELARVPAKHLHRPWEAPAAVLALAGVELGGNYPAPVVDHAQARAAALGALSRMRE